MKWSIVLLVALGLLAAIFVSALVGALRISPSSANAKDSSSMVEVVLAANGLSAMAAVGPNDLTVKTISKRDLPEGYLCDPVQAIGRILAISVVKDQIVTKTCFVGDGDRAKLASVIPHGMRAVSVTFPSHAVMEGLLYPGCIVDVFKIFAVFHISLFISVSIINK